MDSELPNLGEQELQVLRCIAANGPVTARDVVETIGSELGLARTTVLTVIERLRKKGYVTRKLAAGVFVYLPRVPQAALLQDLVKSFVEKSLGGAVSPVVAYLASVKDVSSDDLAEMQRMVDELKIQESKRRAELGEEA